MAYTKLGWVNDRAPALNQTNLNHMDQGIFDAHSKLEELEDIFTGDVDEAVQNWLDEHPEATTTVQDGSLTEEKFSNALKLKTINYYITPEMFGAVCDGVTDDAAALQACIRYSHDNKIPIKITNDIYIDSNMNVPSYVRIDGATHYEYYPFIIAGPNCSIVFDCVGICNIFKDFGIKNYNANLRTLDGIVFRGGAGANVDSELENVSFAVMDRCVVVKGRNTKITNCGFGQARIGVHFDLPSDQTQFRGLQIDNCRFHEIGSFADLNWFENSACIWIQENTWSNLTVRNCIADQSGTFIYGYCTNGLIENNFVESFKMPLINIDSVGLPGNQGSILISGNTFNGKRGSVLPGVTVELPDNIVRINNSGRISLIGNVLRNARYEAITIKDSTHIQIDSNAFIVAGAGDASRNIAVLSDNSNYINMISNVSEANSTKLFSLTSASIIYVKGNSNFAASSETNASFIDNESWMLLGTCTGGSSISFSLPNEFLVRLNDGKTCFRCSKYGNYISNGIAFADDGLSFYSLSFTQSSGNFIPLLRQYQVNNMSNPTSYGYTMYVYALRN